MDDLLKRLDDAANDTHYIDHITAREAAARIRALEAQLAEARAEGFRRGGREAATQAADKALIESAPYYLRTELRHYIDAANALYHFGGSIRALPWPDDLK